MANLREGDLVEMTLFGQPKKLRIMVTGDNQFDASGKYKADGFELTDAEIACLNWLLENVKLEDYAAEIAKYCEVNSDTIEDEIDITGIAVNVSSKAGSEKYPEVALMGECKSDPEHGICIGFRDGKLLGIEAQDWVL